jgi:hypothetical protein
MAHQAAAIEQLGARLMTSWIQANDGIMLIFHMLLLQI